MDSAWIGVIGSLGGVLLTSGVGIAGAALSHRWQDEARGKDREDRLHEGRAALRRDAYTRFLVAGDQMADFLLTQPPPDNWQEDLIDLEKAGGERLRMLWSQGDSQVAGYGLALMQARLLAGVDVAAAIEKYNDWMFEQLAIVVQEPDPIRGKAFGGRSEKCKQLVQVMRLEQESDLLDPPRSD